MSNFYEYDYLCHHGVLGMKWGIRRYQNYDGTLIKSGSATRKRTKYTNIDGSLNERGKIHAQKYMNKEIKRNEKYYSKYINKYDKLAEKHKDDKELHKKFTDMKKDAIRSRDEVDKSIKTMSFDELRSNEQAALDKALKIAGTVAGVGTLGGVTGAAAVTLRNVANVMQQNGYNINGLADFVGHIDYNQVANEVLSSPYGRAVAQTGENIIRGYADAKSAVMAIAMDQAAFRLDDLNQSYNISGKVGKLVGDATGQAVKEGQKQIEANYDPEFVSRIISNTAKATAQQQTSIDSISNFVSENSSNAGAVTGTAVMNFMNSLMGATTPSNLSSGNTASSTLNSYVNTGKDIYNTAKGEYSGQTKLVNAASDATSKLVNAQTEDETKKQLSRLNAIEKAEEKRLEKLEKKYKSP